MPSDFSDPKMFAYLCEFLDGLLLLHALQFFTLEEEGPLACGHFQLVDDDDDSGDNDEEEQEAESGRRARGCRAAHNER